MFNSESYTCMGFFSLSWSFTPHTYLSLFFLALASPVYPSWSPIMGLQKNMAFNTIPWLRLSQELPNVSYTEAATSLIIPPIYGLPVPFPTYLPTSWYSSNKELQFKKRKEKLSVLLPNCSFYSLWRVFALSPFSICWNPDHRSNSFYRAGFSAINRTHSGYITQKDIQCKAWTTAKLVVKRLEENNSGTIISFHTP